MYCDVPDFGRCCFCLPLRRGALTFGYVNIIFCALMVGFYSYFVNEGEHKPPMMYHGVLTHHGSYGGAVCIAIYCVELVLNCVLVYGAHAKNTLCVKIFFYYAITTTVAALLFQFVEFGNVRYSGLIFQMAVLTFVGLCVHLYLILIARSLIKKLQISDNHAFDNQLHLVVSGERKPANGIYDNNTVLPIDV